VGSKFLIFEFLSTLSANSNGVKFRLFNEEHDLTWGPLSIALGFNSNCLLEWSELKGMKSLFEGVFLEEDLGERIESRSSDQLDP
jgi:hypothetical protein